MTDPERSGTIPADPSWRPRRRDASAGSPRARADETNPGSDRPRAGPDLRDDLLGALAAPLYEGKVYLNDDLGLFHYPLRYFYGRSLAAGEGFLWCPNLFCGFYLQGEGQVGMTHPWHLLLYSMLSTPVAINVELLASYPWAFAGVYLFLRRRGLGRDASALGVMVFAFAGFNLFHYMHLNGIAIVAQIPWLLFCSDVAIRADGRVGRAWGRLGVGLGTASQILLGYPHMSPIR